MFDSDVLMQTDCGHSAGWFHRSRDLKWGSQALIPESGECLTVSNLLGEESVWCVTSNVMALVWGLL